MNNIIFFSLVAFTVYIVILTLISIKMASKEQKMAPTGPRGLRQDPAMPTEGRKLDLELVISPAEENGTAYAETIIKNPASGVIYNYAFYLVVDGERKSVRWHDPISKFEFLFPESGNKKEIVAFVRDDQNYISSIRKTI